MEIKLTINNEAHTLSVEPNMPLLWAIRDIVGLTGTKYACGKALCGACAVHMDGQPVRSCTFPVSAANGRSITTIEGLSPDGNHPVQKAWRKHNVAQCGYCQSGQIMSAAALLERNPKPTRDEIRTAMNGNICRCGTYNRIEAAIADAAEELS